MNRTLSALALLSGLHAAAPAAANEFAPVHELSEFIALVEGRELRLGIFGIALSVRPDGKIEGSASGRDVTGTWDWQDGYFCREMEWGDTEIPYNCQLVEASGTEALRFTVDRGEGQAAVFNLR